MTFWYLGTQYSRHPQGIHIAHMESCEAAATCIKAGIPVFCPIAHTHHVAQFGKIDPLDHEIWLPADRPFMMAAIGMIVLQTPGWETSYGLRHEMEFFEQRDRPILIMTALDRAPILPACSVV